VGLIDELGKGPVALDTSIFIYFIEEHPRYLPHLHPVFAAADRGQLTIVTSAVTLLEVLVLPYRAGHLALAERYEALLTRSRGVVMREIDQGQLRAAAKLRAVSGLRTPDALQFAAALSEGCHTFLTNDHRLRGPPGTVTFQLEDYVAAAERR
jgi:predicted nucleic acid-binding protein